MAKVQLFDNLIYNIDRHSNNIYITNNWDIILIDHSRSFRPLTSCRPSRSSAASRSRCSPRSKSSIARPSTGRCRSILDGPQIEALLKRRDAILARARRLVEEQGEAAVLFP